MEIPSNHPNAQYFQIFLRLRPSSPQSSISESRFLSTAPGTCHVYLTPPTARHRTRAIEKYAFTKVFDEDSTQVDVFNNCVLPLLQESINGRDAMLATLGVTGSGKTHTILGNKEQKGMIQMSLEVLFTNLQDRMADISKIDLFGTDHSDASIMDANQFQDLIFNSSDAGSRNRASLSHITPSVPDVRHVTLQTDLRFRYAILISMYELYNDRMFDLLEDKATNTSLRRKGLVYKKQSSSSSFDSSKDRKKVVSGLRKVHVGTLNEALQILEYGQACRRASPTNSNLMSSRSHAFFQVEIKRFSSRGNQRDCSSLQIVDLAGSERARNAQTAGQRLAEAGSINRSLMSLGQCLQLQTQAGEQSKTTAPWRQSKLTEILFSNTLSSVSHQKAAMIVTADAMGDLNATWQILRYSAIAKEVTVPRAPSGRHISEASDTTTSTTSRMMPEFEPIAAGTDKDALIARLLAQLDETESQWRDAEERCLLIEQTVREEIAAEMDAHLEELRQEYRNSRDREDNWREEYTDEKLEIFKNGLDLEDEDPKMGTVERIPDLLEENDRLRNELTSLKRQIFNQSSCKTSVTLVSSHTKQTSLDTEYNLHDKLDKMNL